MESPNSTPTRWATEVHRGPLFALGKFECPPQALAWREENWIGDRAHVVFPRTSVLISQRGVEVVSDPNMVMLYNAGETYSRALVDPRGDRCFYAELEDELVTEMLAGARRFPTFPDVSAPLDARLYALQWRTVRSYEHAEADVLALDEAVLAVLGAIVGTSTNDIGHRPGHHQILERAKLVLNERLYERLTLSEVAALVHISPYHLTRLFHRYTGMPLHRYRTQLRLRVALGKLEEGRQSLRQIASASGFSSHSHFTASFRQAFGFTPLEWRGDNLHPCTMYEHLRSR